MRIELKSQRAENCSRRYTMSAQQVTDSRGVDHKLPVPENVTLFAKSGCFAPLAIIAFDAISRGLLFCVRRYPVFHHARFLRGNGVVAFKSHAPVEINRNAGFKRIGVELAVASLASHKEVYTGQIRRQSPLILEGKISFGIAAPQFGSRSIARQFRGKKPLIARGNTIIPGN